MGGDAVYIGKAFGVIIINLYQTTRGHILETISHHTHQFKILKSEYTGCKLIQRTDL